MNNQNLPIVCLCVPTYNSGDTLVETLDSLLQQTYPNICVLVIDNASTDNTVDIANSYKEKFDRIQVLPYQRNVGGAGNFTRCIQLAEGDYMAIYHSDDIYTPTMVAEQVAFLEAHIDAGAVFTSATYIDEVGVDQGEHKIPCELVNWENETYTMDVLFPLVLKYMNFFMCPSAMVRMEIYKQEISCLDGVKYRSSSDLDVWFRILERHAVGFINKPLMKYRICGASYSYHYIRTRTERHDFFLVMDAYVNKMKDKLTELDLVNYSYLIKKDDVSRAISLLIRGERKQSRHLASEALRDLKISAISLKIDFVKIALIAIMTYLLGCMPMGAPGRRLLYFVRFGK